MSDDERRLHAVVEQAAIGIAVADREGRIIEANPALERMLGHGAGELTGVRVVELTHPEDQPESVRLLEGLVSGKRESYDVETRCLRRDGEVVWCRVVASVARGDDGVPALVVATVEAIGDRMRAEQALAEAEARYRTLVEELPLVTYIDALDDRSSNIYTSPQLEPILGYTVDEWQSDPDLFVRTLHPDDRERVLAEVRRTNETGERFACEYRLITRDGRVVWLHDESVVVRDADGQPLYSQGYLLDITQRKASEEALRASGERFRAMADDAPVLIWTADAEGSVTFLSRGWLEFTGRPEADQLGDGWRADVHPDDLPTAGTGRREAIRERRTFEAEYRLRRHDGEYRWLHDVGRPRFAPDGTLAGYVGVAVDVTDAKRAQEALERRDRILEAVARIAGLLLTATRWDEVDLLRPLGEAARASRAYIFSRLPGHERPTFRYLAEWTADGISSLLGDPRLACYEHERVGLRRLDAVLSRGDVVAGPVAFFPEEERAEWARLGVVAAVAVPVFVDGEWWGYIGCVDCVEQREWSGGEIEALRVAAGVLGGAIHRQRVADALRESEARFSAFMDTTPAVAFAKDVEGRYVYVNARWAETFGQTPPQVLGRTDAELFPEDAERFRANDLAALAADGPIAANESVLVDGRELMLLTFKFPFRDAAGRSYVGGTALDVSQQERATAALRETTQTLESIVENSPLAIVTSSGEGLVTGWNPAAERMFGWERDEVLGKPPPHFLAGDDDGLASRRLAQAGKTVADAEAQRRRKDGTLVDVRYAKAPLRDATGAVVGTMAMLTDVSERKRAERALLETSHELEAIVDSSPLAIVAFDREGRVTRWNLAAEEIFGWSQHEVVGRFNPLLPEGDEEAFRRALGRALEGRAWRDVEARRRHKDGHLIDVSLAAAPLRGAGGAVTGMVAVLGDITEQKQVTRRLEAQHAVSRALATSTTVAEAGARIVDAVCRALDWELGALWLVDGAADELVLASIGETEDERLEPFVSATAGRTYPRGEGLPGRTWERGEPVWIGDLQTYARASRAEAIAAAGLRGCFGVPIRSEGQVLGVLEFFSTSIREPDRPLLDMLESVGGQIAQFVRRAEATAALGEREERFRTLVDNLPGALYRCSPDPDWTMAFMSDAIEEIVGYPASDFVGNTIRTYASIIAPEERDRIHEAVDRALAAGEPYELEYQVVHADGSRRWVSEKGQGVCGPDGQIAWLDGALFDVTERKRAEAELAHERELMRVFMETTPDHIYFKDLQSRFLRISRALADWLGLADPAEAIGKTDEDFFTAVHAAKARADELELIRTGEPMIDVEDRETWPDGSATWVVSSRLPLRDEHGRIVGTFGISRDVTERKRGEQALADARNLLDSVVENLPVMLFLKDAENLRFVRVNRALEEITGVSREELIGRGDLDLFPSEQAEVFVATDRKVLESGMLLDVPEERLGDRVLHTIKVPIVDEQGRPRYLLGISVDITEARCAAEERERLVARLEEQNEQLRQLDAMKDEFVALVSHELRTPLTSILGYLELVLDGDAGEVTEEQRHFLSIIERNADRLLRLVGDLLFVAQIEAGKLSLERGPVDLVAIARDCIEAARPRAGAKSIELCLGAQQRAELVGDRVRLAQLLDNLVSNAIKFTPEGGRVEIRILQRNGSCTLVVSDTGIGIPKAEQPALFQRFYRTSEATRAAIQGTGLGLAITKAIAKAHGGTISLESDEGAGTTFVVHLPIEPASSSGAAPAPIVGAER